MTRLEMTVVIVAALLLAVLGLMHLAARRERGYLAAMQASLRQLAVAQESYAYDRGGYTGDLTVLRERGLAVSGDITLTVHEATRHGWSASATHDATARGCYVFAGDAAPVGSATVAGSITCD